MLLGMEELMARQSQGKWHELGQQLFHNISQGVVGSWLRAATTCADWQRVRPSGGGGALVGGSYNVSRTLVGRC